MKFQLISLGCFLLTASIYGKEAAPNPAVFFIHAGRLKRAFTCAFGVEAGKIADGVLHADLHRGGNRFILVSYTEESHPSRPEGRCGSGTENYFVWLRIRGAAITSSQAVRYESCWNNIEGGPPGWTGRFCTVEYERFDYDPETKKGTVVDSKAFFDTEAPDKGLQIVSEPQKSVP